MPHLNAQKISFRIEKRRLTNNTHFELIRIPRDFPGESAPTKSWGIKMKHKSSINWNALKIALTKKGKCNVGSFVKCLHCLWAQHIVKESGNNWEMENVY